MKVRNFKSIEAIFRDSKGNLVKAPRTIETKIPAWNQIMFNRPICVELQIDAQIAGLEPIPLTLNLRLEVIDALYPSIVLTFSSPFWKR